MPLIDSTQLIGFPRYTQSIAPASPVDGDTWREIDETNGYPITIWQWDEANVRWLEYNNRVIPIVLALTTASNATGVIRLPEKSASCLMDSLRVTVMNIATQTTSAFWTITYGKLTGFSTTPNTIFATFDTKGVTTTNAKAMLGSQNINTVVSDTESVIVFGSNTGAPGNIRITTNLSYRAIRSP
jgi:hypothetical protein